MPKVWFIISSFSQHFLSVTLSLAALLKLLDWRTVRDQFHVLFRIPSSLSWLVPVIEISCAVGLWIEPIIFRPVVLGMSLLFFGLILHLYRKGIPYACNCFGIFSQNEVGLIEVGRNGLIFIAALITMIVQPSIKELNIQEHFTLLLFSLILVLTYLAAAQVYDLRKTLQ